MDNNELANKPTEEKTAADYLSQLNTTEEDVTTPVTTEADDTETSENEEDAILSPLDLDSIDIDDDNADEDDESDDDEETKFELPALIPEIENNPEAMAKVKNFEKGVQKIVARAKAKESELSELLPRVHQMDAWGQSLGNPTQVGDAFRDLAHKLAAFHNMPVEQLLGSVPGAQNDGDDWENAGFDSPGEYRAKKSAVQEIDSKYGPLLKELELMREERKQSAEKQAFATELDRVAPRVIKLLAKADNGWTVTKDQVGEAIRALPQFKDNPAKAVQMYFSEDRVKHYAKLASQGTRKPEMAPQNRKTNGSEMPPIGQRSAVDYMRLNGLL